MPMLQVHFHPPASHCTPVHPTSQVQVSGAVQFPPFWQGLVQVAKRKKLKIVNHDTVKYLWQNQFHPQTYECIVAHFHSTVHWIGRFYCLIPAMCSLHHRCKSLQSCGLYWRDGIDHLWENQDHHIRQLDKVREITGYITCSQSPFTLYTWCRRLYIGKHNMQQYYVSGINERILCHYS